ncbi:hypothetical protein ACWCRI_41835, partial [Streptomyces collinus]
MRLCARRRALARTGAPRGAVLRQRGRVAQRGHGQVGEVQVRVQGEVLELQGVLLVRGTGHDKHTRHHANPNNEDFDPDLDPDL